MFTCYGAIAREPPIHGQSISDVDSWWIVFKEYVEKDREYASWRDIANADDFPAILNDFLFSVKGTAFKNNFRWDGELRCNKRTPNITVGGTGCTLYSLSPWPSIL